MTACIAVRESAAVLTPALLVGVRGVCCTQPPPVGECDEGEHVR